MGLYAEYRMLTNCFSDCHINGLCILKMFLPAKCDKLSTTTFLFGLVVVVALRWLVASR